VDSIAANRFQAQCMNVDLRRHGKRLHIEFAESSQVFGETSKTFSSIMHINMPHAIITALRFNVDNKSKSVNFVYGWGIAYYYLDASDSSSKIVCTSVKMVILQLTTLYVSTKTGFLD